MNWCGGSKELLKKRKRNRNSVFFNAEAPCGSKKTVKEEEISGKKKRVNLANVSEWAAAAGLLETKSSSSSVNRVATPLGKPVELSQFDVTNKTGDTPMQTTKLKFVGNTNVNLDTPANNLPTLRELKGKTFSIYPSVTLPTVPPPPVQPAAIAPKISLLNKNWFRPPPTQVIEKAVVGQAEEGEEPLDDCERPRFSPGNETFWIKVDSPKKPLPHKIEFWNEGAVVNML